MASAPAEDVRTRRALLERLKWHGPQDATALAEELEVTPMAVRQHLYELQEQKLVTHEEVAGAIGRPRKLWRLTREADRYFPDAHAELTVGLLGVVQEAFGDAGMRKLLDARRRRTTASYRERLPVNAPLRKRLEALAALRSAEGYMAEVQPTPDGGWLLIENHCPVCTAAASCRGLCTVELDCFSAALGPEVTVERLEHIQEGARRCVYRVAPAASRAR